MENKKEFSIQNCKFALVLGAGDIGSALLREFARRNPSCRIFASKRVSSETPENLPESVRVLELDPLSDKSWTYFVKSLKEETDNLDLMISTFGLLHNDSIKPEKRLEDVTLENLKESFSINAFTSALAGKHLFPFLSRERVSLFAFLSAKEGSISEDHLGGWHSYRASKAALNMFVKNMSIEFSNRKVKCIVLALQPGVTDTKLSRPYLQTIDKARKVKSPEETAEELLDVMDKATLRESGNFESFDGSELPY